MELRAVITGFFILVFFHPSFFGLFQFFFFSSVYLLVVEILEVGYDDRNRQSNG